MISLIRIAGVAVMALTLAPAAARAETISTDFCHALAAHSTCDGLFLAGGARELVEDLLGHQVAVPQSPTSSECDAGFNSFYDAEASLGTDAACQVVWERLGCSGSDGRYLLMQSPGAVENPILCDAFAQ